MAQTSREGRSAEVIAALSSLALRQKTGSGGDVGTLEPGVGGWGNVTGKFLRQVCCSRRRKQLPAGGGGRLSHLLTALGLLRTISSPPPPFLPLPPSPPPGNKEEKRVLPHQTVRPAPQRQVGATAGKVAGGNQHVSSCLILHSTLTAIKSIFSSPFSR